MKRFYVDTNIWLDFALDRRDNIRPLGELAFQFFKKCKKNKWKVLYSDTVIEELGRLLTKQEIEERCLRIVSGTGILLKVESNLAQTIEAEKLAEKYGVPAADALHAVLARDGKAALVSRDMHFESLCKIVTVFLPEEI